MKRKHRRDLAEMIGLAAIVASLLILAYEVREANRATRLAARDSATQGQLEIIGAGIDASVLATANAKVRTGEELTPLELSQLDAHYWRRWRHYERVYYLYDDGVLLEREWEGFRRSLLMTLSAEGRLAELIQQSWQSRRQELSSSFVQYVETQLAEEH